MYRYKIKEQVDNPIKKFHEERILAFDDIESRFENIKKLIRQGKIETIKYYRDNPDSYSIVIGTDLISDYINDIETLLKSEQ
jgi:hypothetical protein